MKACIILPTYNERDNIAKLLDSLLMVFKSIKNCRMDAVVVDDNSPDGTGKIVKEYAKKYRSIRLITGQKRGLGAAYINGFQQTINKYDVLVMMDSDLSHNPKQIPEFLDNIDKGNDLVIGSRYIPKGSIHSWNLLRKAISSGGNFFARTVSGLYKIKDCTSGYRAIRTDLLRKIDFKLLSTRGYAFQITLLYELFMSGAKIKEIPITFHDRKFGETKLTRKDMIEFFFNALRLRLRTWERFTKFLTIGAAGVVVNTYLLWLLTQVFGLYFLVAGAISIELAILFNFVLNDAYTFKDNIDESNYFIRMLKFNGVALYGFVVNLSALYLLVTYTGLNILAANLAGILAATIFNYVAVLNYTWRTKSTVYYPEKKAAPPIKVKVGS